MILFEVYVDVLPRVVSISITVSRKEGLMDEERRIYISMIVLDVYQRMLLHHQVVLWKKKTDISCLSMEALW